MRKFYLFRLVVLVCVALNVPGVHAQTAQIGNGAETPANTLYAPIYRFSNSSTTDYSRANILYTASELSAAGIASGAVITSIAFYKVGNGETTGGANFEILMANTGTTAPLSTSTTWSSIQTTHTSVYSTTSQTIPPTTGWITFNLTTPFTYTGGSLEIAFDWNISGVSGSPSTAKFDWQYTTGFADHIVGGVSTSTPPATLNATTSGYKHRPNIQITYSAGSACTSPPVGGTATASPATAVCSGSDVQLSLTGNSSGTGQTYVWQSSATAAGPFTDASASSTNFSYTANPTATTYYRAAVTCSGNTQYSDPVEVLVNQPLSAGVYTINPGVPTGAGNYQTLAEAANALSCGITGPVVFKAEPYSYFNERLVLPEIPGASSVNTITFKGYESTIFHSSSTSGDRAAVVLDGSDHVTIDSFTIDVSGGSYGWGVSLTGQADSNTISNNRITTSVTGTSTDYAGIVISATLTGNSSGNNGNGNLINRNTIKGGYWGISVYGSTSTVNQNNRITNNIIEDYYYYSIYAYGNNDITISRNDISRPTRSSFPTTGYNVYLSSCTGVLLEKNRMHDLFAAGLSNTGTFYNIYLTGAGTSTTDPNRIENNLVYQINKASGTIYGIYGPAEDNWNVYHNTIVLDDASSTAGSTYGIYIYGAGVNVKNNIVVISRGGTGTKYALYYSSTGVNSSNINVLYMNAPAGTNYIGYYSTGYATLADWQTANGGVYDQQSLSVDPLFYNAGSWDYTPFEPSINNIGDNTTGVTTDIIDSTRNAAAPDPGAYEFNLGACVNPPTAGDAVVANVNVCAGVDFTLDLAGNSIGDNQTYQWQSSPDNINWTNINVPETVTSFTTSQASTTYYRAAVKCGAGATVYSNSIQVISPALVSGTFTINSGVPTGVGNFQTFNDAINHIKCGINGPVVFNVEPGSYYNEQVLIPVIAGTSTANTITINGYGATIDYISTNSGQRAVIELDGTDHLTIDSLNITSGGTTTTEYGYGIRLLNNADSNTIRDCNITLNSSSTSTNYAGIVVHSANSTSVTTNGNSECDNNIIDRNIITGGYYGVAIVADGGNDYVVSNNRVTRNMIRDFYSYGIYANGGNGTVIDSNDISRPTRSTVSTFYGIYLTEQNQATRVTKNRIHNSFDGNNASTSASYGVYVTGSDANAGSENLVANNMIYAFNNAGTQYGFYNSSSDSILYYYNSILLDAGTATSTTYLTRGFYQTGVASGIAIVNNIFMIARQAPGQIQGLYFNTASTDFESDHNDIYISTTSGSVNAVAYRDGNNYTSLADWQASSGNPDLNSTSADPLFFSPTDLHISAGSPVEHHGKELAAVPVDIDGQPRDVGLTDIGADELISPPCAGANGGVATATDSLLCVEGSSILNVTGFSTGAGSTFQWQSSTDSTTWTDITGETNPTGFATDTLNSTTYFRLKVICSNGATQAYSNTVTIRVNASPTATITSTGTLTVCEPNSVSLNLGSTSAGSATYQWMMNGTPVSGQTANTYAATTSGSYFVQVTDGNTGCSGNSDTLTVTVNPMPQPISILPSSTTTSCPGSAVRLIATGGVIQDAGILAEDFNGTAAGWTTINNSTGGTNAAITAWTLRPDNFTQGATFSSNDNSQFMLSNSDAGGSGNDTYTLLQSPAFSTMGYTSGTLAFHHYYNDYNAADSASVEISTDGINWTTLDSYTTDRGTASSFAAETIDISAYVNQPAVYVRFRYMATWGFYWAIDNVGVTGDQSTTITWSPAAGLYTDASETTAYAGGHADTVYAQTTSAATYTVTATSASGCTTSTTVTVTFDTTLYNTTPLAGTTGGPATCAQYDVSLTNNYFSNCSIIATVHPSGTAPVSGMINTCVTVDDSVNTTTSGQPYLQRHFNIYPAVNAMTATSTITLYYLQSEFDTYNANNGSYPDLPANASDATGIANLRITQYNGTGTTPGGYTGTATQLDPADANIVFNSAANRWEVTFDVTGSGGFYVHSGNWILPVTLVNFRGEAAGNSNRLLWTTATETNNRGFELERSADGRTFSTIAFVNSKAADGNSSTSIHYSYDDNRPMAGNNYYRLKQVDKDGRLSYSNIIMLSRKVNAITLGRIYPNPASTSLNLVIASPSAEAVSLVVTDLGGKVVMQQVLQLRQGANTHRLNVGGLAQGSYFVKVVCASGCEGVAALFVRQ
ncbi:MAG: Muc19 precursor [Chitinophagaceae bacterium]|nr:Muc19 precursor [Chitinophagaceae bacterium]